MRIAPVLLAALVVFVFIAGLRDPATGMNAASKDQSNLPEAAQSPQQDVNQQDAKSWDVWSETSSIDDSRNVYASSEAERQVADKFGRRYTVTAHVDCREKSTHVYFVYGGLMMADSAGWGHVTVRLDKQKARRLQLTQSTDYRALGLWQGAGVKLLKSMAGGKSLLVIATPYNESSVEAVFSLAGFDAAIAQVRKACGW